MSRDGTTALQPSNRVRLCLKKKKKLNNNNVREKLQDTRFGNDFLNLTLKVQAVRGKKGKFNLTKIKFFCAINIFNMNCTLKNS